MFRTSAEKNNIFISGVALRLGGFVPGFALVAHGSISPTFYAQLLHVQILKVQKSLTA